jgi:hypothetical protein
MIIGKKGKNKKKSDKSLTVSSSDRDRIRTCDPQLRRLLLYPAELRDHPYNGAKVIISSGKTRP